MLINFFIEFQQRQLQLRAKAMHLEVQISGLQKEGVSRLKQRMKEVSTDKTMSNKIKGLLKKLSMNSMLHVHVGVGTERLMLFLQLGIQAENPSEFLTQAKKIVTGHKELQGHLNNIQGQVSSLEMERNKLVVSSLSVHT